MEPMESDSQGEMFSVTFIDNFPVLGWLIQWVRSSGPIYWIQDTLDNQLGVTIKCSRTDKVSYYINKMVDELYRKAGNIEQLCRTHLNKRIGKDNKLDNCGTCKGEHWGWRKILGGGDKYCGLLGTDPMRSKLQRPRLMLFMQRNSRHPACVYLMRRDAHVDKPKRRKLDSKAIKWMFLGYNDTVKGVPSLDLRSGTVDILPDRQF